MIIDTTPMNKEQFMSMIRRIMEENAEARIKTFFTDFLTRKGRLDGN